jgi:hypothetical protein
MLMDRMLRFPGLGTSRPLEYSRPKKSENKNEVVFVVDLAAAYGAIACQSK